MLPRSSFFNITMMKKLILSTGIVACAIALFSFTSSYDGVETLIIDEDHNAFYFDDGGDCTIHLGEDWAIGDDC